MVILGYILSYDMILSIIGWFWWFKILNKVQWYEGCNEIRYHKNTIMKIHFCNFSLVETFQRRPLLCTLSNYTTIGCLRVSGVSFNPVRKLYIPDYNNTDIITLTISTLFSKPHHCLNLSKSTIKCMMIIITLCFISYNKTFAIIGWL